MKLADLHIRRHDDGTYAAVWGPFMLKSGFQPIFRMAMGSTHIRAFEALCRPFRNGAPSSPGQFFPIVPRNESYRVELQTRAVHVLNAPSVLTEQEWLFLNFDPSMFTSKEEVDTAINILDETLKISNISSKRVVCEVTEHRTEESNLLMLVSQLRNRGFRIAVDDYGADDSDIERVRKLSPDIIKFDAYWITNLMDSGPAGADLLQQMVHTFKQRGILTLFEGIEHGWQLDLAVDCGVELVQGYVLARPQTVPLNFHHFRSKQNMNSALRGEPALRGEQSAGNAPAGYSDHNSTSNMTVSPAKLSGFNAWENEISTAMESPKHAIDAIKATDPLTAKLGQSEVSNGFSPPARSASVAPLARQNGFAPTFGTRGTVFGQRR